MDRHVSHDGAPAFFVSGATPSASFPPPSLIAQCHRVKRPWCPMATRLLYPPSQQVRPSCAPRRTLLDVAYARNTESIYFSRNLYARAFGGSSRITTGSQQLASLLRRYVATSVAQWSPTRRVLKAMDATGRRMLHGRCTDSTQAQRSSSRCSCPQRTPW